MTKETLVCALAVAAAVLVALAHVARNSVRPAIEPVNEPSTNMPVSTVCGTDANPSQGRWNAFAERDDDLDSVDPSAVEQHQQKHGGPESQLFEFVEVDASPLNGTAFEAMSSWVLQIEEFGGIEEADLFDAWLNGGLEAAWFVNRKHFALRNYLLDYQEREYARWTARRPSVALETEVQPAVSFIAALPNPDRAWGAINAYSTAVINEIHNAGEEFPERGNVPAKFALFKELTEQASADTALMEQILRGLL